MLPLALVGALEKILEAHTSACSTITSSTALAGGSINKALKVTYAGRHFFVKWNHSAAFPLMFEKESAALATIDSTSTVSVPEIIGKGDTGTFQFLVLGMIHEKKPSKKAWQNFGEQLARLHNHSQAAFGLDYHNYIGSLEQNNKPAVKWPEFFCNQRLDSLFNKMNNLTMIDPWLHSAFDRLKKRLDTIFPDEQPALVHGDLWNGNIICDHEDKIHLIDPALYYGHREMDLAMAKLFGGFTDDFFDAYQGVSPLQKDWQHRTDVCNLYPVMVHAILFGESYVHHLRMLLQNILRKFD